jgi:toxin ParE1/3/4
LARWDAENILDHYIREAGPVIAHGFLDALQAAYRTIADFPSAGSPRYGLELGFPELRTHILKRYPYIVFYAERDDHVDIWRVLHAHRDIPQWLRGQQI